VQPPVSGQISRRRFVSGSVAVAGGVALLGRTGLAPHRLVSAPAGPAGFSLVQASTQASATGSVTLALPNAASTPGSLLVATVMSPAASTPFTPPAGSGGTGWQLGKAVSCAGGRVEQWYWANNPGGLYGPGSGAVFTGAAGASCRGGIAEFSTPAGSRQVLDTVGQMSGTGYGTSMPVASAGGVFAGTLGVFSEAEFFASSIGSAGASWTNPSGYTRLASLANNAANTWAHSYNGNLAAGYQNPSGGLSYSGPGASTGWAALLCCYRAVRVSPINWCGAEVTNCLALDATGQQLIVGGDVEGIFRTANFGDNWQPSDYGIETGARQSFAFVAWSELEPGYVYAGGGHSAGDGAFLVSKDGGATWSQRSKTTIWWYGNATPAQPQGPRPSATPSDQDRSVGRLLAQDPVGGVLYSATGSDGVMQSTDNGVTWTSIGLSGSGYWPRCIVLNPANGSELWVGAWDTGNGLGGVWHHTPAQGWSQLSGFKGTVADLKVIGTGSSAYLYAACDTGGIYRAPVSGGPLVSLNGTGSIYGGPEMDAIDTTGSSLWVSLDGYLDASGNHQVIAGCSMGYKFPGDASNPPDPNYTNIVRIKLPGASVTGITYTDLTGPNPITIATFPPFDTPWWHAGANWQSWLGGSQNGNPHILIDPKNHQRIFVTGHGGFFRSYDGGNTWQLACNGMEIIAMHAFAIDPNDGSHFVTCGDDYTSFDFTDPTGDSGAAGISETNPPSSGMESHGAAFDPVDSRVYLAQNKKFSVNSDGAVYYRPPAAPFTWTDTGYSTSVGSVAPMGLYAGRTAKGARFVLAVAQGQGIYRWTGGSQWSKTTTTDHSAPGVAGGLSARVPTCPFASDATPGVIYCFDKPTGLYCSLDHGQTWTQVWNKTTRDNRTGWLAANPAVAGELWVATDTGLFKLTNASGGTVAGKQVGVTAIGGVFSAGASGIAYAPGGALYAIGLGGASPAPPVTTLYVSNDDGGTWTPWCNGDGSDTSYGSPGGQLGISSTGYLWAASGIHVGYWDRVPT
jgi:hypothetical protein